MTYKMRIKFDNREWIVIDNIEYEGKSTIEFIYKLDNGNYRNVTDESLLNTLTAIVGKRAVLNPNDFE